MCKENIALHGCGASKRAVSCTPCSVVPHDLLIICLTINCLQFGSKFCCRHINALQLDSMTDYKTH